MTHMKSLDYSAFEDSSGDITSAEGSSLTSGCNELNFSPLLIPGLLDTLYGSHFISYAQALLINGSTERNVPSKVKPRG